MKAQERRMMIFSVLCSRRCDTVGHLATEFGVSDKTMRRDIAVLTLSFPIETARGRYGGVKLADWFFPTKRCLTQQQRELLKQVAADCGDGDRETLLDIVAQFSPHAR